MHELSYMIRLAQTALAEIENHPNATPEKLVVEIGELTGVLPYYLKKYYPKVANGTSLAAAALEIIEIPAEAACDDCGTHYHPEKETDYRCPQCKSLEAHFVAGREVGVREIHFRT